MKTFANWRNVGRAMLDARRRKGVTAPRTVLDNEREPTGLGLIWKRADGLAVELWWLRIGSSVDVAVKYPPNPPEPGTYTQFVGMDNAEDAGQVLRVLAALDLIPADIAYAADERYGRCVKCGRLAQWWDAEAEAGERWTHYPINSVTGPGSHMPVVAESNTEHKDAP